MSETANYPRTLGPGERIYHETRQSQMRGGAATADLARRCDGSGLPLVDGRCSICRQPVGGQGRSKTVAARHGRPAWMDER